MKAIAKFKGILNSTPASVLTIWLIYIVAVATLLISAFFRGDGLMPILVEFLVNAICFLPVLYYLLKGRLWVIWAVVIVSLIVFVDCLLDGFKLSGKDWVVNVGMIGAGLCVLSPSLRDWYRVRSKMKLTHSLVEKCFAIVVFGWLAFMGYVVVDQERHNEAVIAVMTAYDAINDYDGKMTAEELLPYLSTFEVGMERIDISACPSRFRNKYEANLRSVKELIARLKIVQEIDGELKEKMKTPWGTLALSLLKVVVAGKRAIDSLDIRSIKELHEWGKAQDKQIYEERKDCIERFENAVNAANEAIRACRNTEAELLQAGKKYGFQEGASW